MYIRECRCEYDLFICIICLLAYIGLTAVTEYVNVRMRVGGDENPDD